MEKTKNVSTEIEVILIVYVLCSMCKTSFSYFKSLIEKVHIFYLTTINDYIYYLYIFLTVNIFSVITWCWLYQIQYMKIFRLHKYALRNLQKK